LDYQLSINRMSFRRFAPADEEIALRWSNGGPTADQWTLGPPIDPHVSLPKAASAHVEIGAVGFERIGANKIVASFQTGDGERLQYLMTTGTVIALVNAAAACINKNVGPALGDLRVP
jgi:hypothetical protein